MCSIQLNVFGCSFVVMTTTMSGTKSRCSRFGVSISMIGGMVKKDCDDPEDVGQFCWSQSTQALVIGAYFYGYVAQCFTTFVAKYFTGKP